jgi:urea transport system substrate-binding protein
MDEKNHHLWKSVFIGEIRADGQFNVVWKTPGPVRAQPWSSFIPENKGKKDEPEVAKK